MRFFNASSFWFKYSYDIPLPKNHRFTSSKFSDLYEELKLKDFYKNAVVFKPQKASVEDLEIVHDREYILKIKNGKLSEKEIEAVALFVSKEGKNWKNKLSSFVQ